MKFVPENQQEEKPIIELVREGTTLRSTIKYPEQQRTLDDEYDDEYEHKRRRKL